MRDWTRIKGWRGRIQGEVVEIWIGDEWTNVYPPGDRRAKETVVITSFEKAGEFTWPMVVFKTAFGQRRQVRTGAPTFRKARLLRRSASGEIQSRGGSDPS